MTARKHTLTLIITVIVKLGQADNYHWYKAWHNVSKVIQISTHRIGLSGINVAVALTITPPIQDVV